MYILGQCIVYHIWTVCRIQLCFCLLFCDWHLICLCRCSLTVACFYTHVHISESSCIVIYLATCSHSQPWLYCFMTSFISFLYFASKTVKTILRNQSRAVPVLRMWRPNVLQGGHYTSEAVSHLYFFKDYWGWTQAVSLLSTKCFHIPTSHFHYIHDVLLRDHQSRLSLEVISRNCLTTHSEPWYLLQLKLSLHHCTHTQGPAINYFETDLQHCSQVAPALIRSWVILMAVLIVGVEVYKPFHGEYYVHYCTDVEANVSSMFDLMYGLVVSSMSGSRD